MKIRYNYYDWNIQYFSLKWWERELPQSHVIKTCKAREANSDSFISRRLLWCCNFSFSPSHYLSMDFNHQNFGHTNRYGSFIWKRSIKFDEGFLGIDSHRNKISPTFNNINKYIDLFIGLKIIAYSFLFNQCRFVIYVVNFLIYLCQKNFN